MTQNIIIPNITETYNGNKYAYTKEGKYNTEYLADCIEHGEKFGSSFFAPSTYTKKQLMDIGQDIAQEWGGECIDVFKIIKRNDNNTKVIEKILK